MDELVKPQEYEISQSTLDWIAQRSRESLFFFAYFVCGFTDLKKEIHRPLCQNLQNPKNTRQVIILPRDWFKTSLCSIAYPLWRAINNPEIRFLLVQNTYGNACKKLSAIKDIIERNEMFRMCFSELLPDEFCTWRGDSLQLKRKGSYPESTFEAAGCGTQITGRHYDMIIEDDTIAPEQDHMTGMVMQPTQAQVEKAIGFHRLCIPLLIHPLQSQILVVGTRWLQEDLLSWIMENEHSYKVTTRAIEEDEDGNPCVGGTPAWPERFSPDVVKAITEGLGSYMTMALYYNDPMSASDQTFRRDWIMYYQNMPDVPLLYCTTVDPAPGSTKGDSDPDYNVVMTTAVNPRIGTVYVVHYDRVRCNPGELINIIFTHERMYHPHVVKVEAVAYQRTLQYWIKERMRQANVYFNIEEVLHSTRMSKEDRIRGLQPYFQHSRIFITRNMPELETELMGFPRGKHDDVLDALAMHIEFWCKSMRTESHRPNPKLGPNNAYLIIKELRGRYVDKVHKTYGLGLETYFSDESAGDIELGRQLMENGW